MSIISFGNPDVILLFRDVNILDESPNFLGTDVIFNVSPIFRDRR